MSIEAITDGFLHRAYEIVGWLEAQIGTLPADQKRERSQTVTLLSILLKDFEAAIDTELVAMRPGSQPALGCDWISPLARLAPSPRDQKRNTVPIIVASSALDRRPKQKGIAQGGPPGGSPPGKINLAVEDLTRIRAVSDLKAAIIPWLGVVLLSLAALGLIAAGIRRIKPATKAKIWRTFRRAPRRLPGWGKVTPARMLRQLVKAGQKVTIAAPKSQTEIAATLRDDGRGFYTLVGCDFRFHLGQMQQIQILSRGADERIILHLVAPNEGAIV